MSDEKDIFISYQWAIKPEVKILDEKLTKMGLNVWRDERDLQSNDKPLTSQLSISIKKSKIFLCCITEKYCKSHNCNLEIEWANTLNKPLIVLMIERLSPGQISDIEVTGRRHTSGVGFIIK